MKHKIISANSALVFSVTALAGCGQSIPVPSVPEQSFSNQSANGQSTPEGIAFSPVVCRWEITPCYGTLLDCITTSVEVYSDNTVKVYCGGFSDGEASMDYIYGESYEITEEQKQSVIDAIKDNEVYTLGDCGDYDSCDGATQYIRLFDKDGKETYICGGLNPFVERFENAVHAINGILPEKAVAEVNAKAREKLERYLLENYPDRYGWLKSDGE